MFPDLSKVICVATDTISRIENGQRARSSTIRELAAALDVEPDTLVVRGAEDNPSRP